MTEAILYAETNSVCILLLLLISNKACHSAFLHEQRRLFLAASVTNMFLFLLDIIWIFVDCNALPISHFGNWLLNGGYYALSGLDAANSIEPVCEAIHAALDAAPVSYPLTLSIGVAKYTPDIPSQQALIALADQSLYQAKRLRHGS